MDNLNQHIDTRVNVVAIMKSYKDVSSTVTSQGKTVLKREIVIADKSNKEATATLWAENARDFNVQGNLVVEIRSSPVKSFRNQATISVSSIEHHSSPNGEKLKSWLLRNPSTTPVSTSKRRLDLKEYETIESQTWKHHSRKSGSGHKSDRACRSPHYVACKNCKTGIITVLDEDYCPKCKKKPSVFQRIVLSIKIKDFDNELKLFQDNMGCLIPIEDNMNVTSLHFENFIGREATFLIVKRTVLLTMLF